MSELKRNKIILVCDSHTKDEALEMARAYMAAHKIEGDLVHFDDIEKVPLEDRQKMLPELKTFSIEKLTLPRFEDEPMIIDRQPNKHTQRKAARNMQNLHRGFNPKKR